MATAFVALGSNLGDRAATLLEAVRDLSATPGIQVVRLSTFHDTAPVGGPVDQPRFLNGAVELATALSPEELLGRLQFIEQKHGRRREEKDGPRTLDLDLLLFDDLVRPAPDPILPHPRMHERRFVLAPLAEIAADRIHPQLRKSVGDLLAALPAPANAETPPASPRPLTGLRALVTGSTSGIGRAIALAFATAGADVIVHGRRSGDEARTAADAAARFGVRSHVLMADLKDPAACRRLATESWAVWGGLDLCVLNAGADVLTGVAASWPFERKLAELLAVDVTAAMLLARDIGERMRTRKRGAIITMGWDQAETGMEGDSGQLFAAAKGAVIAFTRSLARSLAPEVRVNGLSPGWIRTAWGAGASDAWQQRAAREAPLGRWGTPDDVAAAAVWLASPSASFVTGQMIRVNGGAVM